NGSTIAVNGTVGVIGGAVSLNADQTLTFTTNANSTTDAFFTYTVKDGSGAESAQATVTIDVTPVNDAPVAALDGVSTPEDTAVTFDVRTNDTDVDSPSLVVTQINGTTLNAGNGFTVTLGDGATVHRNGNGTLTYTPAANVTGTQTPAFSYTVSDGLLTSNANVNVTITAVNDAPFLSVPGPVAPTEDMQFAFTGGNTITVSDVDAGAAT